MDPDHYLSIARICLKFPFKKAPRKQSKKMFNTGKLKEPEHQEEYQQKLSKKLIGQRAGPCLDEQWKGISNSIKAATEEALGPKAKLIRSSWFDNECLQATKDKNKAYNKRFQRHTRNTDETYHEKRRAEKRLHQRNKREWENKQMEGIKNL